MFLIERQKKLHHHTSQTCKSGFVFKTAISIKSNVRILNVIAVIFFLLTLFAGLLWAIGNDIEAIAFTLSMISSTFFGLPYLAEFIAPSRKAVKDMTHEELLALVKVSDAKEDWQGVSNSWVAEVFLKEDPRLRFRVKYSDEGVQCEDYKDQWANRHLNPRATGYWYDLFYDGNLLHRFVLVAVDGGIAQIPAPEGGTNKISLLNYQVALINGTLSEVDNYIHRSRLEVDHES